MKFVSKQITTLIKKFRKNHSFSSIEKAEVQSILKEHSSSKTSAARKEEIVRWIKKRFYGYLNFDHPTPVNYNNDNISDQGKEGSKSKPSRLDNAKLSVDAVIQQFYDTSDTSILYKFKNMDDIFLRLDWAKVKIETIKYIFYDLGIRLSSSVMTHLKQEHFERIYVEMPFHYNKTIKLEEFSLLTELHNIKCKQLEILKENYVNFLELQAIYFLEQYRRKREKAHSYSPDTARVIAELKKNLKYLEEMHDFNYNVRAETLFEILNLSKTVNIYDIDILMEFLKNPPVLVGRAMTFKSFDKKELAERKKYRKMTNQVHIDQNSQEILILEYVKELIANYGASYDTFSDFIEEHTLKKIYHKANLLKGLELTQEGLNYLPDYKEIINQKQISISKFNKESFELNEDVKLKVSLKNIDKLFIKIFEINLENYYFIKKSPVTSNISLEGIFPSFEEEHSFTEPSSKIHEKTFKIDNIPKKRGLYVAEFMGNGYSARAVIKRGRLSKVAFDAPEGQVVYLLDEENNVCVGKDTGVWIEKTFLKADEKGRILVPFSQRINGNVIFTHDGFSEIDSLDQIEENYYLRSSFYLNHESLILGNVAKVLVNLKLMLNSQQISLSKIKNVEIAYEIVSLVDNQHIPQRSVIKDVKLEDGKECEFEFSVPNKLLSVNITISGKVYSFSEEKNIELRASHNFEVCQNESNNAYSTILLTKRNQDYILRMVGRNGNAIANHQVTADYGSNLLDYNQIYEVDKALQTDSEGEINMGPLKELSTLRVTSQYMDTSILKEFNISSVRKHIYSHKYTLAKGEELRVPVEIESFEPTEVILTRRTGSGHTLNAQEYFKLEKEGDRQFLVFKSERATDYSVELKTQMQRFDIVVYDGTPVLDGRFIQCKDNIFKLTKQTVPVYVKEHKLSTVGDNYKLELSIGNATADTRVHLVASNFISTDIYHYLNGLTCPEEENNNFIRKWKNMYLSNRKLDEEIQYVIDRKQKERLVGNSLAKPSGLLNRKFVRDTVTNVKNAQKGTDYARIEDEMRYGRKEMCYDKYAKERCLMSSIPVQAQDIVYCNPNLMSPFFEFLCNGAQMVANGEVSEDGKVIFSELPKEYGLFQVFVIGDNTVYSELIEGSDQRPKTRPLTMNSKLDFTKSFCEKRNVEITETGKSIKIQDPRSVNYKIIDSIEAVLKIQKSVAPNIINHWERLRYLQDFDKLTAEQQEQKLSQTFGYEPLVYLYFKHPSIFSEKIKPILKFKAEKKFVDFFLLEDWTNLKEIAVNKAKIALLNPVERVLLVHAMHKMGMAEEAVQLAELAKSSFKEESALNKKKYFDTVMSMTDLGEANIDSSIGIQSANVHMTNLHAMDAMCARNESRDKCFSKPQMRMKKMAKGKAKRAYEEFDEDYALEANAKSKLFSESGTSKEYQETHYLIEEYKTDSEYLAELASSWAKGEQTLLSKNVYLPVKSLFELILVTATLDLPNTAKTQGFVSNPDASLEIKAKSNFVIFTKEISESEQQLNKEIMIAQHVKLSSDNQGNKVKQYVTNKVYTHETIVTNIGANTRNFELLIQVPNGSIPCCGSLYTATHYMTLRKFETKLLETKFYFPSTGNFSQYGPSASIDSIIVSRGECQKYEVHPKFTIKSTESISDILMTGSKADILKHISENTIDTSTIHKVMGYCRDKAFYEELSKILEENKEFNLDVENYAFYHNEEDKITAMIGKNEEIKGIVGGGFTSSLITVGGDEELTFDFEHLDYSPVINPRAHVIGGNKNLSGIKNAQMKETWGKLIMSLVLKEKYTSRDWLRLTYYLVIQEKLEDALITFERIDTTEFEEFSSFQLQYDYLAAYLDFSFGYPEIAVARKVVAKYEGAFLTDFWNELFAEIKDQIVQFDSKVEYDDIDQILKEEEEKAKKGKKDGSEKLEFSIEGKELKVIHMNVEEITVKYYLIDLEILFSRTPFEDKSQKVFSYVPPVFSEKIALEKGEIEAIKRVPVAAEYANKNVIIEVASKNKKLNQTYLATGLNTVISQSIGEIKVMNEKMEPLPRVYVKCYSQNKSGESKFYKDGYTDLRGRFDYASLNTDTLGSVKKFALFVSSEELGEAILETEPPKMTEKKESTDQYAQLKKHKQKLNVQWRSMNKMAY